MFTVFTADMKFKHGAPPVKKIKNTEMVEKKRTSPPTKTENNTTLNFTDMVEAKRASDSSLKKYTTQLVIFTLDRFYRDNASRPGRKLEDLCQQKGLLLQPGYLPISRWGSLLLPYRSVCPFRQEEFGD